MPADGTYLSTDLGSAQRLQVSAPSGSHTPGKCLMLFKVAIKEGYQFEEAFWMLFFSLTLIASVRPAPAPSSEEAGRLKAAYKGVPSATVMGEFWPVFSWSCNSKLPTFLEGSPQQQTWTMGYVSPTQPLTSCQCNYSRESVLCSAFSLSKKVYLKWITSAPQAGNQ